MAISKSTKADPLLYASPPDPNQSFVMLPRLLTAGSVAVSLESLLKQVQKQPASRQIESITLDRQRITLQYGGMT